MQTFFKLDFKLVLLFCIGLSSFCGAQTIVHQDIFKGGVTGDGYNPGFSYNPGVFNVHIENGSTIRNAFLFSTAYNSPSPMKVIFDGTTIYLNTENSLTNDAIVSFDNSINYQIKIIATDVKNLISPNQNIYSFTPPYQYSPVQGGFTDFYLYITYTNPLLNSVNTIVYCNEEDIIPLQDFNLLISNPMNFSKPVALALGAGSFCDTIKDGSYIKVNNVNIGFLGGEEYNSNERCGGVAGSFYYKNQTLYGLGNDTPTNTMSGSDALADISSYINNPSNINVLFDYQGIAPRSNPVFQLFLTYVSTCDPFDVTVTPDTTICFNSSLQLHATGGTRYEWQPATGLSCADCPDPNGEHR